MRFDGWHNAAGLVREVYLQLRPLVYVRHVAVRSEWVTQHAADAAVSAAGGTGGDSAHAAFAAAAGGDTADAAAPLMPPPDGDVRDDVAAAAGESAQRAARAAAYRSGFWRLTADVEVAVRAADAATVASQRRAALAVRVEIAECAPLWLRDNASHALTPRHVATVTRTGVSIPRPLSGAEGTPTAVGNNAQLDTADEDARVAFAVERFVFHVPATSVRAWSTRDAQRALYRLRVRVNDAGDGGGDDTYEVRFGFRQLQRVGTKIYSTHNVTQAVSQRQ